MKVKIITEIIAEIDVFPDDPVNSDSVGEYKAELDCDVSNGALDYLSKNLKNPEEIKIISSEPCDEGIEEYSEILNNWKPEYKQRIAKHI